MLELASQKAGKLHLDETYRIYSEVKVKEKEEKKNTTHIRPRPPHLHHTPFCKIPALR